MLNETRCGCSLVLFLASRNDPEGAIAERPLKPPATRSPSDGVPVGRRLVLDYRLPGVATIVAVVPVGVLVRVRTDAKHAVDATNDATSGSANDAADHSADRSEHAVARISAAISSVVNTRRHALRVRGEWQRKK
jgi:hypothetical protein